MASILIGTPSTGAVRTGYTETVFATGKRLQKAGHESDLLFSKGADIIRQRNAIGSRFLEDSRRFSHLFWLDSDVDCPPTLCERMLGMNKPFVAAPYPRKRIDLPDVVERSRLSPAQAREVIASCQQYTIGFTQDRSQVIDGACVPHNIAIGCALIRRDVFERMIEAGAAKIKRNDDTTRQEGLARGLYNFFDLIYQAAGGDDYLPEDLSFCHRWVCGCGGAVWAIIDEDIGHTGDMRYGEPFILSRAAPRLTPPANTAKSHPAASA